MNAAPSEDDFKKIGRWINNNPKESMEVISVRAGLRSVPILEKMCISFDYIQGVQDLTITIFSSLFFSWAKSNNFVFKTTMLEYGKIISRSLEIYSDICAESGDFVRADALSCIRATVTGEHKQAILSSIRAYSKNRSTILEEILNDIDIISRNLVGDNKHTIWSTPLWSKPAAIPDIDINIKSISNDDGFLLAGFSFWFDWYNHVINPNIKNNIANFSPEFINWIANQPNEWWSRNRKAINTNILQRLNGELSSEEIPSQVDAAFLFQQEKGCISVAGFENKINNLSASQIFLDDMRNRAKKLLDRLVNAKNIVPHIFNEVEELLEYLPENASDINPYMLKCRLISIDGAVETLQTAGMKRELADDPTIQITGLSLVGRELLLCFPDLRTREREDIYREISGRERAVSNSLDIVPIAARAAGDAVNISARLALDTITQMDREIQNEFKENITEARRIRLVERVIVKRNFLTEVAKAAQRLTEGVWDRLPDHSDPAIRGAFTFGIGAFISKYLSKKHGEAYTVASYGKIDQALKILYPKLNEKINDKSKKKE